MRLPPCSLRLRAFSTYRNDLQDDPVGRRRSAPRGFSWLTATESPQPGQTGIPRGSDPSGGLDGGSGLPAAVNELFHVTAARPRLVFAYVVAATNQVLGVGIGDVLPALADGTGPPPVPQLPLVDLRLQGSRACGVHASTALPSRS